MSKEALWQIKHPPIRPKGKGKEILYTINKNGCHICVSHCRTKGYPIIRINGKLFQLSRYVWELINGPITNGLYVLHTCDNRACVNPKHLYLGTQKENMHDAIERGSFHHLTFEERGGWHKGRRRTI